MNTKISVDLYTKVVLTVIALCLVWLCLANARSVTPLGAQEQEPVDVRIVSVERQPASRWDAIGIEADASLPTEVTNEASIPVVVTNELVPVDIRRAAIKQSLTPLDKQ